MLPQDPKAPYEQASHLRLVVTATVGWVDFVGCFFEYSVYQGLDFFLQHTLTLAFYYQYSVTLYRVYAKLAPIRADVSDSYKPYDLLL